MIDSYNQWWNECCERAERTTARQLGIRHPDAPMAVVRQAVHDLMAPKAQDLPPVHRSASVRTALMLAAANKKRAKLGQPLIPLD